NYYLDNSMIINPRGHKGNVLEAELIATFLPHIVVDSLYTVMNKAGLEVQNLTLEPIAAINVTIPQNLRLLNLVLVDVGAGTSDIAITKDGTIVAYGMVAKAGDAITEKLSKEYLLDFNEAEKLKTSLNSSEQVKYTDVLGMMTTKSSKEVSEMLYPVVQEIASEVARVILEVNERPPSAVFCIGGGCQVPGFTEALAESLSLQKERTVIKGAEMLEKVHFASERLSGPEYITPVGIGFTAFQEKEKDFLQIVVNDKPIRLFNSRQLNVSDALILVGYNARNLIASRGDGIKVMVNGKEKQFYGEYGESAKIFVNGVVSSLDTKIKNKDVIHVEPAVPGSIKEIRLYDLVQLPKKAYYNQKSFDLIRDLRVNQESVAADVVLNDKDWVQYD
ncbi:MAG: rod shape-determining protein, partial [Clostridia bacterium]|nr:rod shape-determining protein [Clostridia bacterium]